MNPLLLKLGRRLPASVQGRIRRKLFQIQHVASRLTPERPVMGARRRAFDKMTALAKQRPLELGIELSSVCNARCVFCAYPKIDRPKQILAMDLFERICEEFSALGGGLVALSAVVSDPLTDPHYLTRVKTVRERFPRLKPHTFTNGIALGRFSDDELEYILDTLDHINISIGGLEAADYLRMFAVDRFEKVWSGLERIARLRASGRGTRAAVQIHIRTDRADAVRAHPRLAQLRAWGFNCDDIASTFSDWGGVVRKEHLPKGTSLVVLNNAGPRKPCLMPMYYPVVLPDGRVSACACFEMGEDLIVGDLRTQTLAEVWHGLRLHELRESFRRGQTPTICRSCTMYRPYDQVFSNPGFESYEVGTSIWTHLAGSAT